MSRSPPLPPPSVYSTTLQAGASAPAVPGLQLAFGVQWDSGGVIPQPIVQLAGQDVSGYVVLTVDARDAIQLSLDLRAVQDLVCGGSTPLYLLATLGFSPDGASFVGTVTRLCGNPPGGPWTWCGAAATR